MPIIWDALYSGEFTGGEESPSTDVAIKDGWAIERMWVSAVGSASTITGQDCL